MDRAVSQSVLRRHANDCHNGVIPDYVMNVTGVYHGDAMLRQIIEAIKIRREGFGKTQSEEDDLSVYCHISETAEIIRSLRNLLARGQLATEEALDEAISLRDISYKATCVEFLLHVDVPQLLTDVVRSLYQKVPVFSSKEQSNSEVECALDVIVSIYIAILNFSDSQYSFCKACGEAGVVKECLELLQGLMACTHDLSDKKIILKDPNGTDDQLSKIGDLGFNILGVLHNLLKTENSNEYFESCDAVEILLSFYRSQFPKYRMTALLCLAYLVDEKNNNLIMAAKEPVEDILKLLEGAWNSNGRRCQGFSATEIAVGLSYLARNDGNKRMIGQLEGIPLLVAIVEDKTDLQGVEAAVKTLYTLSLHEENKARIKANDKKGLLKRLYDSSDEGIQEVVSGVIREIKGKKEHNSKSSVGKNQSEEDDLSVYSHISQAAKIIQDLRDLLTNGQLATEKARTEAINLRTFSDEATCVEFLVHVDVPKLLTEVLRSLYPKVLVFSYEEQSNSEVKYALDVIGSICIAILNFSDFQYNFCEACGEAGLVEVCLELLQGLKDVLSDKWIILKDPDGRDDQFSAIGDLGLNALGVLHNLLKTENTNKCFEGCGAVETLLSFKRSQFPKYQRTALLCLAYLVDEENNDSIMATEELIKDLLKLLEGACNSDARRCQGFSAAGIAVGLSYLASNDGNKRMIGQLGGIPILAAILDGDSELLEGVAAVKTLYMLSLAEENKAIIKDNDNRGVLKRLYNSSDEGIQQVTGVIKEIEGKKEHSSNSSDSEEHIMISYQWKYLKAMLEVKTELESKGLRVWMDVDKMSGDTLETMARAVEKSSVILIAMSREYQNSKNCRSEASYAYELGKKIIPLMMEENYKPDGWLGLILATKNYMHFEKDPCEGIQQLLKEITNVTAADTC
ncbi:uncharacterized protein LOC122954100 [Acropora millepora]|uniref:uncharacterized protein LOC122954100 n=1 Tax=Acropora millepora TaxID=45264 RepID=UPI001CF17ADE|nr:uncharacterized protein LOC122954100 [Acropora millepora]